MANHKSSSTKKIIVLGVIVFALMGLGAYAYFQKREVLISVQTEKVARRNLTETVVANGKIQPIVQIVISPEVSGEIVELPVKDGQRVKKGDLLVRIKPDNYVAQRNSVEASLKSSLAAGNLARANRDKAELEFQRFKQLFQNKLVSDSQFLEAKTSLDVASAQLESSTHQASMAKASLAKAEDDLAKTTIYSPAEGTVTKLKSQLGERVLGTAMMAGTEIMTIADLSDMEARVDVGEIDVVLIKVGQKTKLEVDAFRDRKFNGTVTEIANAARNASAGAAQQDATRFEVKIHIEEKESFRPGMSVTAEIETRYRTNVLTVPIQSVTTRVPKTSSTNAPPEKKKADFGKPVEVVFVTEADKARMITVKRGVSDDSNVEILEGVDEGQAVVSGGYKAINRELEDGKLIKIGPPNAASTEEKK